MIDSHVHIDAKNYREGHTVANILFQAAIAGVDRVVSPSLHMESFRELLQIRQNHPGVYPAAGVHPHEASRARSQTILSDLKQAMLQLPVPIVGETGLEGHYDFIPLDVQLESLDLHLEFAHAHGLPVILHCRETEEVLYHRLKAYAPNLFGVIHCFTGTWEWAQRFLELGFHIGITGIVTFKNSAQVQEVATRTPAERLLVETDGPYLAPIPFRGKLNKPEYIPIIVKKIAELRGAHPGEVADFTTTNTEALFGLPKHEQKSSV
ncbi:MAG: TatD family hydrolase [Vulcanimicrobiota bacterium]